MYLHVLVTVSVLTVSMESVGHSNWSTALSLYFHHVCFVCSTLYMMGIETTNIDSREKLNSFHVYHLCFLSQLFSWSTHGHRVTTESWIIWANLCSVLHPESLLWFESVIQCYCAPVELQIDAFGIFKSFFMLSHLKSEMDRSWFHDACNRSSMLIPVIWSKI